MKPQRATNVSELKDWAKKLQTLRKLNPPKYYECKGRIDALYENEIEKRVIAN